MRARIGTLSAHRGQARRPTARLLPFQRNALTHVLILGGCVEDRRSAALAIHAESLLRSGSFVGLDCASEELRLSRALTAWMTDSFDSSDPSLMAAARGTLFLDQVDALSASAQRLLLEFVTHRAGATTPLESRWGGRLISGSGADLDALTASGRFLLPLFDCLDKARLALDRVHQDGAA